jgi:diguanylate cyclase (GGDEF)-like protein/PAS domain S-box-containing protein
MTPSKVGPGAGTTDPRGDDAELESNESLWADVQWYRNLFDSSRDALFVVDRDCRIQFANIAAVALLRQPADDVIRRPLLELFPQDVAERHQAAVLGVLESGESHTAEVETCFPSGPMWQHVALVPLKDANGDVSAVFGIARDISDLKTAEAAILASEARYRALVEAVGDVVFVVGRDDRVEYVNAGAAQWFRSTPAELIGKSRAELFPDSDEWGGKQAENLRRVLESGHPVYVENVAEFPGGSRWQGTSLAPVRDADGQVVAVMGIGRDITTRKLAEEALRETNAELETRIAEIERLSSQVAALNRAGQMLLGCRTTQEVYEVFLSLAPELFPGTAGGLAMRDESGQMFELIAPWGDASALDSVFSPEDCWALRLGRPHLTETHGVMSGHVAMDDIDSTLCVPLAAQGHTLGLLTLLSRGGANLADDILQQHAMSVAEQMALALANVGLRIELENQAFHDPLTHLYNRRFLDETLLREFRRAERKGEAVAVVMFDVDHFKRFNDEFGHAAGDEVLRTLAIVAQSAIRDEDAACRFGGDEILLVLPGVSGPEAAHRAEVIRERVSRMPLVGPDRRLPLLTMSAGVACYPHNGDGPVDVLAAADMALYRAKEAGRDRVEIAD